MTPVLADIAHGHTDGADISFLFALILAVIAGLAYGSRRPNAIVWAPVLLAFAVACLALGWILL